MGTQGGGGLGGGVVGPRGGAPAGRENAGVPRGGDTGVAKITSAEQLEIAGQTSPVRTNDRNFSDGREPSNEEFVAAREPSNEEFVAAREIPDDPPPRRFQSVREPDTGGRRW